MAVTITGAKYAVATLSSAGTTTVTCTGTPFTTADFTVARRVDLYNNALTTFKGCAFVRSATSTSVLSLETEFFDPKTGATVTQVAGGSPDKIYVSKNWADVATTGIAISGNEVTLSDTITWGTANDPDSLSFHDEDAIVNITYAATNGILFACAGGVVTFGHLQSWANKTWYGGVAFNYATTLKQTFTKATSTSAQFMMFGGSVRGNGSASLYVGSGDGGGASYAYYWMLEVVLSNCDAFAVNAWGTGADHVLENCTFIGKGSSQILVRWRNGSVIGGQFKIPNNSTSPISMFGDDAAGTFAIGAPAGIRSVILDMGSSNALWRSNSDGTVQTINCTNLISTDFRAGYGGNPETNANTSATKNLYFQDNYTNLQDASGLATICDSDFTADDTDTSSGAASTVAMQVFYGTGTGHTAPAYRGPWTYRIRKYGYDEQEGAIAQVDYSLGTAGTAKNVAFGGAILQIARASLTGTAATQLALAGITVTDHGASPVTWNSKAWSITVEVDLATYPARTAAEVFRHIKAGIASTATFNGKAGLLWHVLVEEDGSNYVTQRGKSGGAGASLKGVRVIDQAGNPMTGFTAMIADDGTTYTPPTLDERGIAFTGLIAGSQVKVFETTTTTELFSDTNSATSETWSESASGSLAVSYMIQKAGYEPIGPISVTVTGAVSGGVQSVPVSQVPARWYVASSGLTINTNAFANATTKKFGLTTASTLQNFVCYLSEQWIALGGTGGAFANKPWPLAANGPNSFTWLNGWEADLTTYPNTITNFSRDGMRYLNASGNVTAIWAAILTSGVPSGARVRYQQSDAGTTVDAAVASGNMDELVHVLSDPNGDGSYADGFDRRSWLVLKVQEQGYDQAEFNVVTSYETLQDQFYVCGLAPTANGVATGDPSLATAPTITQGTYTEDGKTFSVKIVDGATANTGTGILRWLRYWFETGGAFQSEDAFNWHDLVRTNGTKFKTVNGVVYGTATTKGVLVYQNDGTTLHHDFDLFTADNGTTYAPIIPVTATATILAGSRVQLYNVTTATEIDNVVEATTSYSYTITTEASDGDTLRLRVTKLGYEPTEVLAVFDSAAGATFLVSQSLWASYTAWGIDGSTVTEFSLDVTGNIEIDANDVDGATTKTRLGAFYSYALTTADGIRSAYGAITSDAPNVIRINVDVVDLTVENTNATTALRFTDTDVRLYRSDGTTIIALTSYSIHNDYSGVPDVVETGVSGLTGPESAQLMGLPSASANASATLAAAQTTPIHSDVKKVAGTAVTGSGTELDPWGP